MVIKSKGLRLDKNGNIQLDRRCKEHFWYNQNGFISEKSRMPVRYISEEEFNTRKDKRIAEGLEIR